MPPPAEGIASRLVLGPALRTQPDRRLVKLVREGYESAFEEIVRRYGRPLTRYAAAIVGGRSEDVTQDAFSKALLALRRDDDAEIDLRPWLFRIVRNTALNDLRDSPPSPEILAEAIAGGANPAEEMERREELADLMRRLQALPEPQRAAIVMRELEGLGHEEIAAALGLSGGAARQAIYRARRALRKAAGLLVPLPLMKMLLTDVGPGTAEAAAGAAGIGGIAGSGLAVKATAATVLVAGAVGTGVALEDGRRVGDTEATARETLSRPAPTPATSSSAAVVPPAVGGDDRDSDRSGSDHGPGGDEPDDERDSGSERSGSSGHSRSGPGDDSGSGSSSSGPGHGSEPDDDSGDGSSSGPGSGEDPESSSGSGSGSGSESSDDFEEDDDGDGDSSGSGSEGSDESD